MNNKLTLSLTDIESAIDNCMEQKRNFMLVCDYDIAFYISNYVEEIFGILDRNSAISDDSINEFYVSIWFNGNTPKFFCESARGKNYKFKVSDMSDCDYLIQNDIGITVEMAHKYLLSEGGTWSWYEIVDEDDEEFECDHDCENCEFNEDESDDSFEEECRIIYETLNNVLETEGCPDCILKILIDFYSTAKSIGYDDGIQEIKNYIETINS